MRRKYFLLSVLLLHFAVLSFSQQIRGIGIVAYDPVTDEEVRLYNESWALLVGVNKYRHVTPLDYAVADAKGMKKLLVDRFHFNPDRVVMLLDEQATGAGIKSAFSKLLRSDPEDRLIVFFAGHGTQIDLPTGGEMGFLVPVDGKVSSASDLYTTCISMQELRNLTDLIPAKHQLFLVDACYGGLAAVTSRSLSRETQRYLQKLSSARARQIITAGGKGEQVIENPKWGHSAFTYKLIEGLEKGLADLTGDYLVTATELFTYLKPAVTAAAGNRQTPVFKSFSEDEGDFVFVLGMPTYRVSFVSTPPTAVVMIDGESVGLTPLTIDLERGNYELQVFKSGYQLYERKLNVTGKRTITAALTEDVYELAIASNPSGGQVFINGVERGTTALVVKMKPGDYTILVEKEGYHPWTQEIAIYSNESVTARLIPETDKPPVAQKPEDAKPVVRREKPAREKPPARLPEQKVKKGKGGKTILYVLGGLAVAGGAAAFLLAGGGGDEGPSATPGPTSLPDPPDFP